jgi:thiol-disulfide isomerase/thioredoxin
MYKLTFLYLLIPLVSFGQGIKFMNASWEDLLLNAKKENKIIFVDAYASWCAPCRMMDAKIFPKKAVGDFYNQHFINVKIDMEKGEGPSLANLYQVKAFPTFLFIDPQGNLLHSSLGYKDASAMLTLGKEALDPSKQIQVLKEQYNKGERDPEFLKNFSIALHSILDDMSQRVAIQYLNTLESWENRETLEYIALFCRAYDSPLGQYFLENTGLFEKYLEPGFVKNMRSNMAYFQLSQKGHLWQQAEAEKVLSEILGEENKTLRHELMLQFFIQNNQYEAASSYLLSNRQEAKGDLGRTMEIAEFVAENSQSIPLLKETLKFLKAEAKKHPEVAQTKELEKIIKLKIKQQKQKTP